MKKIAFVCLGNICRSPMAEWVMKDLTKDFHIESRATSSWKEGNPIHAGTQGIFKQYQIPFDAQSTSKQITAEDFEEFDWIIAMDNQILIDLKAIVPSHARHKLHPFAEHSIPDPWYTGDFQETYDLIYKGCQDWLEKLR